VTASLISDGCVLEANAVIDNCLVGLRSVIGTGATIRRSVLMGDDFFRTDSRAQHPDPQAPPLGIGAGSHIEGAIVDKNCRIGRNVNVRMPSGNSGDGRCGPVIVRDGVIVVPKGTILPDGWRMDRFEPCRF
jgi:glucose-1-phosphate adenylyltransferase